MSIHCRLLTLLLVALGLLPVQLWACGGVNQQVYAGKIEYTLDPLNQLKCTATITMDFDINETKTNDSIWVDWGDAIVTTVYATSITEDTFASANMGGVKIYRHVYTGTHTYATVPPTGYYIISFQNEYRINAVNNIERGNGINLPFYLAAQVSIDTTQGGQYAALSFAPLQVEFSDFTTYHQAAWPQVSNDDSVVYSLQEPLETISNPVPLYQQPDQYCLENGSAENNFTMDSVSGSVTWVSPCLQGVYSYGTLLSRYRNGKLLSSIMREQTVYVQPNIVYDIKKLNTSNTTLQLFPNPAQNTLTGTFDETGSSTENRVQIITPAGQAVYRNIPVTNGRFTADVSLLPAGIYFVQLQGPGKVLTEKFVKQ